jgi:hypothetical protein
MRFGTYLVSCVQYYRCGNRSIDQNLMENSIKMIKLIFLMLLLFVFCNNYSTNKQESWLNKEDLLGIWKSMPYHLDCDSVYRPDCVNDKVFHSQTWFITKDSMKICHFECNDDSCKNRPFGGYCPSYTTMRFPDDTTIEFFQPTEYGGEGESFSIKRFNKDSFGMDTTIYIRCGALHQQWVAFHKVLSDSW